MWVDVPEHIRCDECGITLLGSVVGEVSPIARDECPECGSREFRRIDD